MRWKDTTHKSGKLNGSYHGHPWLDRRHHDQFHHLQRPNWKQKDEQSTTNHTLRPHPQDDLRKINFCLVPKPRSPKNGISNEITPARDEDYGVHVAQSRCHCFRLSNRQERNQEGCGRRFQEKRLTTKICRRRLQYTRVVCSVKQMTPGGHQRWTKKKKKCTWRCQKNKRQNYSHGMKWWLIGGIGVASRNRKEN